MLYAKVEIKYNTSLKNSSLFTTLKRFTSIINLIYLVYYSGSDNFKQLVVRGFLLIFMMQT